MSGERIVLIDDAGGSAARLVQVTARLAEAHLGPHALVGGLAVMCRLSAVHRVTQDIDAVTETTAPTALEVITSGIGTADPAVPNRAFIDGVRVDLIDTHGFTDDDLDGIEGAERAARWLLGGSAEMRAVTPDDLRDVIGPLADRLQG